MTALSLLLIDLTVEERDVLQNALLQSGMPCRIVSAESAEAITRGIRRADAVIIGGTDPEKIVADLLQRGAKASLIVFRRDSDRRRRDRLARSGVAGFVTAARIGRLPGILRREFELSRSATPAGNGRDLIETAFSAVQDVVLIVDPGDRRILSCNPAIRRVFGHDAESLVGKTTEVLFPDHESFREFGELMTEGLEARGYFQTELLMRRADGEHFESQVQITPLPDGFGLDGCVAGTVRDVSHTRGAERAVSETREHLENTLNSLQDGVITVDPASRTIMTANPAIEKIFGYRADELIGTHTRNFFGDVATYEVIGREYKDALDVREVYRRELVVPHKDGRPITVELTVTALSRSLGWREGIVVSIRDVTDRKKAEERARLAESVLENTVEGVVITDLERRILAINPAFERLTGYSTAEVLGKTPDILRSGRHNSAFYKKIQDDIRDKGYWQGEIWHRRKDGTLFPAMASSSVVRDDDGRVTHYTGVFTDISHHKHIQQRLEYLVRYDTLTGLPNRQSFEHLIEDTVARSRHDNSQAAVLFLDIDHFKTVNETLGHSVGDEMLREIAERLKKSLAAHDVLARLGGDEFGVIVRDLSEPQNAATISKRLLEQLQRSFVLESQEVYASASIGISLLPDDGKDAKTLMKNADSALFRAKEHGRNSYEFFSREMNVRAFETLVMVNSLRQGIEKDQFVLHFQPRVDAESNRIIGAEALIRWNHPDFGLTMPTQFIPLAEQTGLISALGDWVRRSAIRTIKEWREQGVTDLLMSVNLSAREFSDPDLTQALRDTLAESGLESSVLELEITESMLMSDPRRVETTLRQLMATGIRTVIDDFGTGYSSLNYLKQFPITGLKIDQSFVRGIPFDSDDTAITRAIIAMAQSLNLRLVAEGVETEEQAAFLRSNGCHELQGYLFSPPVTADEFLKLLQKPVIAPRPRRDGSGH